MFGKKEIAQSCIFSVMPKNQFFEHVYLLYLRKVLLYLILSCEKKNVFHRENYSCFFHFRLETGFQIFSFDFDCAITSFANEIKVSRFFTTVLFKNTFIFLILYAQLLSFLVQTALNWIRYFFFI